MFKDFRCVDYGMNAMNTNSFEMYTGEQTTTNTSFKASSMDTPAVEGQASMQDMNMGMNTGCAMPGVVCPPVYECPVEKCVHRNIVHEVPHVCPVNTRIINHHIYRHTYSPCYTCCEENTVSNVQEGSCCCYR